MHWPHSHATLVCREPLPKWVPSFIGLSQLCFPACLWMTRRSSKSWNLPVECWWSFCRTLPSQFTILEQFLLRPNYLTRNQITSYRSRQKTGDNQGSVYVAPVWSRYPTGHAGKVGFDHTVITQQSKTTTTWPIFWVACTRQDCLKS